MTQEVTATAVSANPTQESIANSADGAQGGKKLLFSRSGIFTGSTADYANRSRQGGKDDGQLRFSRGDADTSKPFNLTKVEGERPYYKKNTQATGGALLHSGNAGSSRFDAKSVAAAHQSLENLENSLPNAPAKVKAMLGSLRGLLKNMAKGAPVFVGGKQSLQPVE